MTACSSAGIVRANPADEPVIDHPRHASWNLGTHLAKVIKRVGLKPWPKLFQNLRLTRQNELTAKLPAHVVCDWIGNSEEVAKEHYLRATEADFAKAAEGEKVVRKMVLTGAEPHYLDENGADPRSVSPGETAILAISLDRQYTPQESNL